MARKLSNLRREREYLARAFGAIVLAVAPTAAALQACDSVSGSAPQPDASVNDEAASASDGSVSQDADLFNDAGVSCTITSTNFDSGVYFDGGDGAVDVGCIYYLPCGLPPTLTAIGCDLFLTQTNSFDAEVSAGCTIPEEAGCTGGVYTPGIGGAVGVICTDCLGGGGRKPRGLDRLRNVNATTPVGAYFATMAHEEEASVHAFRCMKQELLAFGAPATLVRAAHRAAREEGKHTCMMQRLARGAGAACAKARVRAGRKRSLEAMAIENAVEGCVNEAFGALLMTWQAENAASPGLRRTFAEIARDEIGHAALSRSVAAWSESQLSDGARARVKAAQRRAVQRLEQASVSLENRGFERVVGWPTPAQHRALVSRLVAVLALA